MSVERRGSFNRLAEPTWQDPLDTAYSAKVGGRWNARGDAVLYLNASDRMARLQAEAKLVGQPFGVEDLDPSEQHDLIELTLAPVYVVDCASDHGIVSAGLPPTYPLDEQGRTVSHATCQAVAVRARAQARDGVVCRSAVTGATPVDTELALFDPPATSRVTITARRPFDDWYLGEAAG